MPHSMEKRCALLSLLGDGHKRRNEVKQIGALLVQEGHLSHPREFTILLTAFSRQGLWGDALDLLGRMDRVEVPPNVVCFNAAVNAFRAQEEQWQRALACMLAMRLRGVEPSIIGYNAAISARSARDHWQRALGTLAEVCQRGLEVNTVSFNALISVCEKGGRWRCGGRLVGIQRSHERLREVRTVGAGFAHAGRGPTQEP